MSRTRALSSPARYSPDRSADLAGTNASDRAPRVSPRRRRAAQWREQTRKRKRERLRGVQYLLRGLLVCQKCGYGFTGHHHRGQWRYYRCCGTDRSRFHGEFRCDTRLVAVEPLDEAVWAEVCRLLENPALVVEEYQRRLDAIEAHPRQLER